MPPALKAQADRWRQTAQRYDTEPETGEGRKELAARAKAKEEHRDRSLAAYHMFEYGSACFQLAIVLAGAAALTSVIWLTFLSVGLGVVGLGFTVLAFVAPNLIHLLGTNENARQAAAGGRLDRTGRRPLAAPATGSGDELRHLGLLLGRPDRCRPAPCARSGETPRR